MRYIDSLYFTYDEDLEVFESPEGVFLEDEDQEKVSAIFDRVETILEDMGITPENADIARGMDNMIVVLEEDAKFSYTKYRTLLKKMKAFFDVYDSVLVQYVDNDDFDGPFAEFVFGDRTE